MTDHGATKMVSSHGHAALQTKSNRASMPNRVRQISTTNDIAKPGSVLLSLRMQCHFGRSWAIKAVLTGPAVMVQHRHSDRTAITGQMYQQSGKAFHESPFSFPADVIAGGPELAFQQPENNPASFPFHSLPASSSSGLTSPDRHIQSHSVEALCKAAYSSRVACWPAIRYPRGQRATR